MTELVGWDLFLYADYNYDVAVVFIVPCWKDKPMSAVSTLTKGNYPRQPCLASASSDCLWMLFSRLKIWRHARGKTKYRVLSTKWFTSISVLIHIAFLVFRSCCLVDTDMDMESTLHKYKFTSSGKFQGDHIESNFLFVKPEH